MKKYFAIFTLTVCLCLTLTACTQGAGASEETTTDSTTDSIVETNGIYPEPYATYRELGINTIKEDYNWEEILSKIPSEYYEGYVGQTFVPLIPESATLFKDGKAIDIDIYDARLIKLLNFFQNSLYYFQYAYTTGSFDADDYNEFTSLPHRLEITYAFDPENPYETNKVILCTEPAESGRSINTFLLVDYEQKWDDEYPFSVLGRYPLHTHYINWLELFGF